MTVKRSEVPVLVVGGGPAGLTAAVALARAGIETLLVERRAAPSALPKATVVSLRSMELLRSWGLETSLRAGGVDVEWLMWSCESLARAADGVALDIGMPTRAQSALISPTSPACVPQDHLEPVLLDHLRSLGPVRVELGTTVESIAHRPGEARAVLRAADGPRHEVRARYVVAADGAYSGIRAALGIALEGSEDALTGLNALFRAPLWNALPAPGYGIYSVEEPAAGGIFLPSGPADRWNYGLIVEPGDELGSGRMAAGRMAERIRLAAGMPELPVRVERVGVFSSAAQVAERFRHENVVLVGDAAHRVTPRGGTGMNTAIHDGYDVGWRLAWVLRGWAHPDLLDGYERERRPVVEHNVARSASVEGTVGGAQAALRVDLGARLPHHWLPGPTGAASTLDLLGPGLTVFAGPDGARWRDAAAALSGPLPVAMRSLDAVTARALAIRPGGALIARPDGVPLGLWSAAADVRSALAAAVAEARGVGAGEPAAVPLPHAA